METSIRMIFELFHSSKAVFTRNFFDLISLRVIQLADLYEFLWSPRRFKLIDFNWNLESNKFLLDGEFSWRKFSFSFSIFEDPTISLFLRVAVDHEWQFFFSFFLFFFVLRHPIVMYNGTYYRNENQISVAGCDYRSECEYNPTERLLSREWLIKKHDVSACKRVVD